MSMLDLKENYRLDIDDMYHKIIHLPDQIRKAYFKANLHVAEAFPSPPPSIERVIVAGMGGSAISGDLLKTAFSQIVPIEVCKDYRLPYITDRDLLIVCSYSGNTEETLSCLETGIKAACYIAAVTANGMVKKQVENKYLWCELSEGFPPRAAIGSLFFSILLIMEKFGLSPNNDETVQRTVSTLMMKAGAIAKSVETDFNIAKQAAHSINNKIPLIYSANPSLAPVAYRIKCQINENAKYPAFFHTLPEMNHNEIEAWEDTAFHKQFIPLFISYLHEEECYKKRVRFLQNLFGKEGIDYLDFYAEGENYLEQAFSLIYLGDMISYYLAILRKVDPTKIEYINRLKEAIS